MHRWELTHRIRGTTSETKEATMPADRNDSSALSQAITIWRSKRRISIALYAELVEQGYDVPGLERFYTR